MQIVAISACVCALSTVGSSGGRISSKVIDSEEEESGMRRACSLSDLSISPSNRLLHGPIQGISYRSLWIIIYSHMLPRSMNCVSDESFLLKQISIRYFIIILIFFIY